MSGITKCDFELDLYEECFRPTEICSQIRILGEKSERCLDWPFEGIELVLENPLKISNCYRNNHLQLVIHRGKEAKFIAIIQPSP